jgi:hypothetical protein
MRAALEDAVRATWELAAVELPDDELGPALGDPPAPPALAAGGFTRRSSAK